MASSIFLASFILSLILFHFLFVIQPALSLRIPNQTPQTGFRASLTRSDSSKILSRNQYDDPLRDAKDGVLTTIMESLKDEYVMKLVIGTPPVQFSAIMDTGSDLIWTDKCESYRSSSFSSINDTYCDTYGLYGCKQTYEDGASVSFSLGYETFTIGNVKTPNVIFGCGKQNNKHNDYDGVVGMGRGKLSLVSQLNQHVFAYCMASRFEESKTSVLLTGSLAKSVIANGNIQTMPLLKNSAQGYESLYYIPLEGISVGETRLPVTKSDFAISNEGGGMIIDSGTTFTYLEQSIINMIENAFMNQTKLKKIMGHPRYNELKHCFKSRVDPKILPNMVFHFKGANWELPGENYFYHDKKSSGVACLGFIASEKDESIFGNMQQQNMMVVYDLDKNSLSFGPAKCHQL